MTGSDMKKQTDNIAIKLINVSKKYEIHHEKPTLVEKFVKGRNETFWALKNINLTIKKGERVGINGANGSGKTTLLKIITGIASPSSGSVATRGKVVSIIDLSAGFHPDLPGIENIYLNGILIGMTKKEIDATLPSIIDFAEIKQFIDTPVYTYSAGMQLRLGFAVAIHSNPDIMIMDEGFLAGDENFQEKAMKKIQSLRNTNLTMLIVSHWQDFLLANCERIITFSDGIILSDKYIRPL